MLSLDIRTLSFLATISSLLLAAGLQLADRIIARDPSLRLWALGASANGAGFVLMGARGIVPDLLSIVAANTLLIVGTICLYLGHRSFRGWKHQSTLYWVFALACVALLYFFTYLMPSLPARIVTMSVATAAVFFASAFVLLRRGDDCDRAVQWFISAAYLSYALFMAVRAGVTLVTAAPGQDFMSVASPVHTFAIVLPIAMCIVLGVGLPLLVSGRMQRQLRESDERLRTIADYTYGWEYWLGNHNELLYINAACERISGYTQAEFRADPDLLRRIVHADDRPMFEEHQCLTRCEAVSNIEFRIVTKTGEIRWIAHGCRAVQAQDGSPFGRRVSNDDITDLKNAEERANQLAFFDCLTNLPNRRLLLDRLKHGLSQAKRFGRTFAVMFLDLDRFKQINDTLGHDVGDGLLQEVAARLLTCVRAGDTVSRPGGDEFVIVLPEIADFEAATLVAEKIIAVIARTLRVAGHPLEVTISIGIAVHDANAPDDATELMRKADIAMYCAKQAGRNCYRVYEEAYA